MPRSTRLRLMNRRPAASAAKLSRRCFAGSVVGGAVLVPTLLNARSRDDDDPPNGPREKPFERDYPEPSFKPSWKNPQLNRTMVQDFVIYAHSDLDMVKQLLDREPGLINGTMDWGNGDWENALGGASHMGRKDIVRYLLSRGARMDLFCATMMGMLGVVRAMLELEPALIDARGPHGFDLHFHAQVGQEDAKPVLDYLQSIKQKELRNIPFLKKKPKSKDDQ